MRTHWTTADAEREHQSDAHRRDQQRLHPLEEGDDRVGLVRRSADGLLGARRRAQRLAGSPPLGQEPEHRDEREQHCDELALLGVLPEQPRAVEAEERPRLGPQQRGSEHERERLPALAVEVALEREQHQRDQDALGVAEHRVAQEVGRQQQPGVRGDARRRARPAAAGDPARDPERHHDGQQPAGAGDHQPEVGSRVAERGEQRREEHGQRLPRRAGVGVQVEVDDLAAPLDPRPRVVARGRRVEQRQGGQRERRGDRDREAVRRDRAARVGGIARRARGARGRAECRPALRSRGCGRPRRGWGRRSSAHSGRRCSRRPKGKVRRESSAENTGAA